MSASEQDFNQQVIEDFRTSGGQPGGEFAETPLLLLHTTGAKSGLPRVSPLAYLKHGDSFLIVASKGGAPTNPAWYHNLRQQPHVQVEVGSDQLMVSAAEPEGDERATLFSKFATAMPWLANYQAKTDRPIPLLVLQPDVAQ